MAAAHEDLVRPRVMTTVEDLVTRGASGVLEVTGCPAGAIYLDGGQIAFARASWVPGLASRLRALRPELPGLGAPEFAGSEPTGTGPSQTGPTGPVVNGPGDSGPENDEAVGGDADDAAIAGFAVQHGYLTSAGLHELIRSIVVDAFLVLTIPLAADSPVAAIRFTSTRTYWTETFPRLGLDLVRGEALSRAGRMAEHGLGPTTAVALRELRAPVAVLSREQWAVASQIGEYATAKELAARRGAALSDTIDCLGSLTRAGLCGPVRVSRPAQPSERVSGRASSAGRQPERPTAGLPTRYPAHGRAERSGGADQRPTIDVLRQVLSGLRKLN